jgi:hypothetical protein
VLAGQIRPDDTLRVRDASGTDTDALLREAGVPPDRIAMLRRDGAIT